MGRTLSTPNSGGSITSGVIGLSQGGTGSSTASAALTALGAVAATSIGQPGGPAALDGSGNLAIGNFTPGTVSGGVAVNGESSVHAGVATTFAITNFDALTTYTVSATNGTVSQSAGVITFTGTAAGAGSFTVNGKTVSLTVLNPLPNAPTITSPVQGALGLGPSTSATTNAFSVVSGSDTHYSSDWQLATDSGFTAVVLSAADDTVNKVSWAFSGLTPATTYYMRCRHKGTSTGYGAWSASISFTTKASFLLAEQAKLTAGDPVANDYFSGTDAAISCDYDCTRVVISSYNKSGPAGAQQGAAYVFLRTGTSWAQEAKLVASDPASGDVYGYSVAMSSDGTRILIGAAEKNSSRGAVYVYSRSGVTWTEEAKLVSGTITGDTFGNFISITPDCSRAIIGAKFSIISGNSLAGAAYIFLRTGTSWAQEAKLAANDPFASAYFGRSVAISNDASRVVIGAMGDNTSKGAAYIFLRTGVSWTQETKLVPSENGSQFGISVSMSSDGSKVSIGTGYGSVYFVNVYKRVNTTWSLEGQISGYAYYFGMTNRLSEDGNTLIVGNASYEGSAGRNQGGVFIFKYEGSSWVYKSKLVASDATVSYWSNDYFGKSIAFSRDGNYVICGSDKNGGGGAYSGAAYAFSY